MTAESKSRFGREKAHSDGRLPSPVNAPLEINVTVFLVKELCNYVCQARMLRGKTQCLAHSDVRLPSPENVPLAIDVIRMEVKSLRNTISEQS